MTQSVRKIGDPPEHARADVVVVGGGMAGMTLAIALAGVGVETIVLERGDPAGFVDEPYDGRASAIAFATARMFKTLGVWTHLAKHACPIEDIRVSDGPSRLFLHYDHRAAGVEEDGEPAPLGYIIENRAVRRTLFAIAGRIPALRLVTRSGLADANGVRADRGGVEVDTMCGRTIRAALAVGADGRGSTVRDAAGIGVTGWSYEQHGIVCTTAFDRPHRNVAHERFLPAGPFALLPMAPAPGEPHRASIVWTERSDLAPAMMALPEAAFGAEMTRRFGDTLGPLRLSGRRWRYPLSLLRAERLIDRRIALVGDAAHGIHPIAGQGLNLGLRDVAALAEIVVDARRLGQDPGTDAVLTGYQQWRRVDALAMAGVTDGLNRLFSNDVAPIRIVRDLGLAAVNQVGPLKRMFMRHAMGLVGDLPRLIAGQSL